MTGYDKERFENKMIKKYGDRFTLVGEFVDMKTNVLIKCSKCGTVSSKGPIHFLNRGTCRGCFDNRHTKTTEQFKKMVADRHGDEFTVLGEYTFADNKILVRHNRCGSEYEIRAASLLQRGGCVFCQPERLRKKFVKSRQQFESELHKIVGDEYKLIGEYTNALTKTLFIHNKCGNKYFVRPGKVLLGDRCPFCRIEKMKSKNPALQRMIRNIRTRVIHVLRGRKKSAPLMELIGCNRDEYVSYIEGLFTEGMSWDNYGCAGGWQLDHIRPCASFDLADPQQQRECFNFKNTQPLWDIENSSKSSYWNGVKHRS